MTMPAVHKSLKDRFLQGMALSAATVNVVTTAGVAGRAGVTVSAMASVSADGNAPTLLVCIHHLSPVAQSIIGNGCFCTNVLKDDQIHISDTFAGRTEIENGDKFSCASWQPMSSGAPRVVDSLAAFDCTVKSHEQVGTHHVFIGEVGEIVTAARGNPLIYANRAYGSPMLINSPLPRPAKRAHYRIGVFHTFGPYLLPAVLRRIQDEIGIFDIQLYEGDQRYLVELLRAGTVDFAFLYDIDLSGDWQKDKIADLTPYVLLAANDELARRPTLSIRELLDKRLILLDSPPSGDYFLSLFDGIGTPDIACRSHSFEMVRGMVAHGLGYSLLATKPAFSMSYDGKALAVRPLSGNPAASTVVLCHRKDLRYDAVAERFLRHCAAQRLITAHAEAAHGMAAH